MRRWQLEGVTVLDPATTWIDVTATLAPDVTVLPNTHILRATSIAEGAIIGPDTSLVDCEVGEDATVTRTDATLAVIGAHATVGPFAYLRPGTCSVRAARSARSSRRRTPRSARAARFRTCRTSATPRSACGVNLGAGTIIANYDDVKKHRTEMGDEVHTGSHNVFVAPVRIGDGAKTGAGAVVRKDVPPGALALTVASQRNIEGWVGRTDLALQRLQAAEKAPNGSQEEDG